MTQIIEQDTSVMPYILTNRVGPFNARWEKSGWRIFLSNIKWGNEKLHQGKVGKILDLLKTNLLAYKILKKHKLSILYCNDIQGFWCAYFGGKLAGSTIIFNLRDTKSADEMSSLKKWQFIARNANKIVVLSVEMKDFVVKMLLNNRDEEKVIVTYSIVDRDIFKPINEAEKLAKRQEKAIPADAFVISYVAAFNEKKAQLPFIKNVIAKYRHRHDIRFYFIGDFDVTTNAYAKECQETVSALGIEHLVTFVGHTSNVDQWYKMSDLVSIASNKEGLARCMIEAISCGTPVISFNVCSANEILTDMRCGEVVEMNDYDAYVKKIMHLMENSTLLKTYGANGVEVAAKLFSKDMVIEKYKLVYP